jgi:hypothetical protein
VLQDLFAAVKTLPIERGTNEPNSDGWWVSAMSGFAVAKRFCRCKEIELFELLLFDRAAFGLDLASCLSVCRNRREGRDS